MIKKPDQKTIYTVGYSNVKLPELASFLDAVNGKLFDIRFSPRSRNPVWNGAHLRAVLGERYAHLKALGNENYKGGPVALVDVYEGFRTVRSTFEHTNAVVLMCVCKHLATCHRLNAAEELDKRLPGVQVVHLHHSHQLTGDEPPPKQMPLF